MPIDWKQLKTQALDRAKELNLDPKYVDKLKVELKEIEKQGANSRWVAQFNDGFKYETNKNGLALPWVLGMTPVEPMADHKWEQQTDWPDIDFDCIPEARDLIKAYAAKRYGEDKTCSVGTWMTYLFRSALQDTVRAYGGNTKEVIILTTNLPDDVDELKEGGYAPCMACKTKHKDIACPKCGSEEVDGTTIAKLILEHDNLAAFNKVYPKYVDMAIRLVGKIKALGTHAGGLIIANCELRGRIPMALNKGKWTSMWTEGRSPQLSKFGFVKWDVLGLKTLGYISSCCNMVYQTRGIKFDILPWSRQDNEVNILGTYNLKDGTEAHIRMDDVEVFKMINDLRTETIFQFETDVQRGVLANGVRDYYDLMIYNAMGHPGPMQCIPDYVKRRDDQSESWRNEEHPEVAELLKDTRGLLVFQEQLQAIWQRFADFTAPEAEAARKAVAKKWVDKLKPIGEQWLAKAAKTLGPYTGKPVIDNAGNNITPKTWAEFYWPRQQTFGRYAFNKSHAVSYIMSAFLTAWLKIHFPPEWWASVMSACDPDKRKKYMNVARSEGVQFGAIDIENLSLGFTVNPHTLMVTPGLTSIKGIGEGTVGKVRMAGKYTNIDNFVEVNGKNKTVLQRLILLGAFTKYHQNIKATWMWYQYKYCGDASELKKDIRQQLLVEWTDEKVKNEVIRQSDEFKALHPKRKVPAKILNWKPKPDDTRERVMALYPDDYILKERLQFEKEYLGYYWHSPMDLYRSVPGGTVKNAKTGESAVVCGVVEKLWVGKTKNDNPYGRVTISDGLSTATIVIWSDDLEESQEFLRDGVGIKAYVSYDNERDSFSLQKGTSITRLETAAEYSNRMLEHGYDLEPVDADGSVEQDTRVLDFGE